MNEPKLDLMMFLSAKRTWSMINGRKAKMLGNKIFLSEVARFYVTFLGTVCFPNVG